ncbi:hypothetical protein DRQ25_10810 [Candidatus Fermentibacteria bacterium]|nr:MAG: hypothetical protein DRQ25_10810 [Candidatus Fermentibacteria bacterium]
MAIHEGPIKHEFHYQPHTGVLTAVQTQATEDMILARNAELRKNPGALRDLGQDEEGGSWGRQMASIPFIMFQAAIKAGFDLTNTDAKYAAKEMQRFLATPKGKRCLVQATDTRIYTGQ